MSFFKKLSNLFSSPESRGADAYWIYVRCNRCGEKIATRVNLRNDLSVEYGERDTVYYCRKVLMGQELCFQRVEVNLKFNDKRELVDREISGGKFINEEEYYDVTVEEA